MAAAASSSAAERASPSPSPAAPAPPITTTTTTTTTTRPHPRVVGLAHRAAKSARPSTYAVRKQEQAALKQQLASLSRQVEALKEERQLASCLMRRAIQAQHRAVTYTQAAVSGITHLSYNGKQQQAMHLASPFGRGLRLQGTDEEREATLNSRRGVSVRLGRAYLSQRRQFLDDDCGAFSESSVSETRGGGHCVSRFEVIPLRLGGAEAARGTASRNVRRVMEALQRSLSNAELVISETSEFLTIRQDGDSFGECGAECLSERGVALHRVLSANARGSVLIEAEAASFFEFFEDGDDQDGVRGAHGVVTTEAVERDDRYPYQPDSRVRRDVSSIIMVSSKQSPSRRSPERDADVVLTLWSQCIFRCPSDAAASREVARYAGWGGGMLKDMEEILRCPQLVKP